MNSENLLVCSVTGLRSHKLKWKNNENHLDCLALKNSLKSKVEELINCGYCIFLSGMATGVDIYFAKIVLALKEDHPNIKLVAVVPHLGQELKWPSEVQNEYKNILSKCDEVILTQEEYTSDCFKKRNDFLVKQCNYLIAVINDINELHSGSAQTARMAIKLGKTVFEINPNV